MGCSDGYHSVAFTHAHDGKDIGLGGSLQQMALTAEQFWESVAKPLARHVLMILEQQHEHMFEMCPCYV